MTLYHNIGGDTTDVKREIRKQIIEALKGAKFPIATPGALLAAFPLRVDTTCKAGDVSMTAGEAGKLPRLGDFPFQSAEQAANTILRRAGM